MAERAIAWGREPDISARSALVTILGDTVAPLGGTVWLADLIALAAPFGFSERLVRTSMFRLAAEGWIGGERVGRRSRYSLTGYGRDEIAAAERRIYQPRARAWDGWWTLVFVPDPTGDGPGERRDELERHLRWRGFARLADGVRAAPNDDVEATRRLFERLALDPAPPLAAARFDRAPAVDSPSYRADSGLAAAEVGYRRFAERYDWTTDAPLDELDRSEAFALRTMIVHDLRRARLHDPELPSALLSEEWVGHRAMDLAASIHRRISGPAWAWVAEVTGLAVDGSDERVALRFAERANIANRSPRGRSPSRSPKDPPKETNDAEERHDRHR